MKYLCLIYNAEQAMRSLPKEEAEAMYKEYYVFTEALLSKLEGRGWDGGGGKEG